MRAHIGNGALIRDMIYSFAPTVSAAANKLCNIRSNRAGALNRAHVFLRQRAYIRFIRIYAHSQRVAVAMLLSSDAATSVFKTYASSLLLLLLHHRLCESHVHTNRARVVLRNTLIPNCDCSPK